MGFSFIYKGILVVEVVVCAFITTVVHVDEWLYTIWVALGYLCLGAHFVMLPIAMTKIFGLKSGAQLASFIYSSRGISALIGTFVASGLSDSIGEESYSVMFYLSCGLILLAACINIFCF